MSTLISSPQLRSPLTTLGYLPHPLLPIGLDKVTSDLPVDESSVQGLALLVLELSKAFHFVAVFLFFEPFLSLNFKRQQHAPGFPPISLAVLLTFPQKISSFSSGMGLIFLTLGLIHLPHLSALEMLPASLSLLRPNSSSEHQACISNCLLVACPEAKRQCRVGY